MAEKAGAQFVDVISLLQKFGDIFVLDLDEIYEDHDALPHSLVAYEIGRSIAAAISHFDLNHWRVAGATETLAPRFRTIRSVQANFSGFPKEHMKNSAVSGTFANVKFGQKICFEHSTCIGMYINLAKTDALVDINDGVDSFSIRLCLQQDAWPSFTKIFVPVPGIKCDSISVYGQINNADIISRYSGRVSPDKNANLSVSDLCFWNGDENLHDMHSIPVVEYNASQPLHNIVEDIFCSQSMIERLKLARNSIIMQKFAAPPHQKLLDVCRLVEKEGAAELHLLMKCFDLGIREYGQVKDDYGHHVFIKEKYRSLLRFELWDEADRVLLDVEPRVTAGGWPQVLKARALLHFGKIEESLREWKMVLTIEPQNDEARKGLGLID